MVCLFLLLMIVSFFAAFAFEEGTMNSNSKYHIFASIFWILRFPSHTLLFPLIRIPIIGILLFPIGLIFNIYFWAVIFERIITILSFKVKFRRKIIPLQRKNSANDSETKKY